MRMMLMMETLLLFGCVATGDKIENTRKPPSRKMKLSEIFWCRERLRPRITPTGMSTMTMSWRALMDSIMTMKRAKL